MLDFALSILVYTKVLGHVQLTILQLFSKPEPNKIYYYINFADKGWGVKNFIDQ